MRRKYRSPHAYKQLRKSWAWNIWALLHPQDRRRDTPDCKLRVTITIYHKRFYDDDNAISGLKPILDSLVALGIIKDDSPEWIELHVVQVKSRENQTTISVEAI
jgi:hypothetical protein